MINKDMIYIYMWSERNSWHVAAMQNKEGIKDTYHEFREEFQARRYAFELHDRFFKLTRQVTFELQEKNPFTYSAMQEKNKMTNPPETEKICRELVTNLHAAIQEWDKAEKNCFNLDHPCEETVENMRKLLAKLESVILNNFQGTEK